MGLPLPSKRLPKGDGGEGEDEEEAEKNEHVAHGGVHRGVGESGDVADGIPLRE